jgi:poly(hydroxyalkanoate) depolymerase family esterase
MSRTFAAALRRASRLMRPSKASRSLQKAMTGAMVKAAIAPLAAAKPAKTKPAKTRSRKTAGAKAGQSLGTVLKQLRAARSLMSGVEASAREVSPRIPPGAQYLAGTHRSTAGSRRYKLYVPAGRKRPSGLILMLHGCGQTPDDFAVGTRMNALAEKHGIAVAYPAQTSGHNAASCWNWFKPGDQGRDAGEPAILASLTRKLMREFGLSRDAVFVAGLSAGGAMAAILADIYPDLFSAAGIHSGLARGAARDVVSAMAAMRRGGGAAPALAAEPDPVRRIVFHGDSDRTVHPSNAAVIVAAALGGAAQPTRVTKRSVRGRSYVRSDFAGPEGVQMLELWMLDGAGHAWSGGRTAGSFTDSKGPDASAQMIRFFLTKSA